MSELNRRDLLRYFGIGATIVPVIGGAAKTELPARLIEEAKVEPVTARAVRQFGVQLYIGDGLSPETFSSFDALCLRGPTWRAQTLFDDDAIATFSVVCDPKDVFPSAVGPFGDLRAQFAGGGLLVTSTIRTFRMVQHGNVCTRWQFQGKVERVTSVMLADGLAMRELTVRIKSRPSIETAHW